MSNDQSDGSRYLDDDSISPYPPDESLSQDPSDWLENARRCGEHRATLASRAEAHNQRQLARVLQLREPATRKRNEHGLSTAPLADARQALTVLESSSHLRSVKSARDALAVLYGIDSAGSIVVSEEEAALRRLLGIVIRAKLVTEGQHRKQWSLAHVACIALRTHRREMATARSSGSI